MNMNLPNIKIRNELEKERFEKALGINGYGLKNGCDGAVKVCQKSGIWPVGSVETRNNLDKNAIGALLEIGASMGFPYNITFVAIGNCREDESYILCDYDEHGRDDMVVEIRVVNGKRYGVRVAGYDPVMFKKKEPTDVQNMINKTREVMARYTDKKANVIWEEVL